MVTATEEFGIAAVESLAAGRPVIALADGGVRETVTEGETGTFFAAPDPDSLAAAVAGFDALAIDPERCVAAARRFGSDRFRIQLARIVEEAVLADARPARPGGRAVNGLVGVQPGRRLSTEKEPASAAGA